MSRIHVILLLLVPSFNYAQEKPAKLISKGDKQMESKYYYTASQYYGEALLSDSMNLELQWKMAESSRLCYDYESAKRWYETVVKYDNMRTYPQASFWLGMILKGQGDYKNARRSINKYYKKVKSSKDPATKQLAQRAKMELDACDYAMAQLKMPTIVSITHLDDKVNSTVSEYAPFLRGDTLFFSSLRNISDRDETFDQSFNKLYYAIRQEDSSWLAAKELDTLFNRKGIHTANSAFNKDFTEWYFSRCKQTDGQSFECAIYRSKFVDGSWSKPDLLPAQINTSGSSNTQPNVGYIDGSPYLFFASNRAPGAGGMDIWYSPIYENGGFGRAVTVGREVNSPEDEITPFYDSVTRQLYFSSTWHKGMGGLDIFASKLENETFQAPVNPGYPVNSCANDNYYFISADHREAFLTSNRNGSFFEKEPNCCSDIYTVPLPALDEPPPLIDTSLLLMSQMKVLVPLTLYFHNDEPNPKTRDTLTKRNYQQTYQEYNAMRTRYLKEFGEGKTGLQLTQAQDMITNFFEDSVDAGMEELETFAALLEEVLAHGENVRITMQGFCSPLATTNYNVSLAKRRISSLRNYFMEYKGGIFLQYVNNTDPSKGRIEFFEENVGELPLSKVSDSGRDAQNSIYSPGAARERKIQIIAVSTF